MSSIGYWLTAVAASAPVLATLIAGLVICHRQRRRRPRVAKLLSRALAAELILLTAGLPLYYILLTWLGVSNTYSVGETNNSWMLRMMLQGLPSSTASAVIWGTVLWAVLQVDDWQNESAKT
jgi:hypothetical protein